MSVPFIARLRNYYTKVAAVLRGEADAASVFPNTTDVGMSRERVYAEFLKQHAPSKCDVFFGGFLFDEDGAESKQLDIIVTTDTAPRFHFQNTDGSGKAFSPVEGTLGVVSVKSNLDRSQLFDALGGIASIPPMRSLEGRVNLLLRIKNYDDWPLKVIYATRGIAPATLLSHLNEYYAANPEIPVNRRPHLIHVAGSCLIARAVERMSMHTPSTGTRKTLTIGSYYLLTTEPDLQAVVWVLDMLQVNASASTQILFSYGNLLNKVVGAPR
jgi:hypothetical protein